MQYAFVDNIKSLPEKGKKGICIGCKHEVTAKCGNIKVHHWAHKNIADCDSWSEPETEWHREWKNKFPEMYREVTFHDANANEYHRADIHTNEGVTIEFQNSPISLEEFNQRNGFYKKLVWVVNGLKFKDNFKILRSIPNPSDPLLNEFEMDGLVYYKKKDIEDLGFPETLLIRGYNEHTPELKGLKRSDQHYAYEWKNKRYVWATKGNYIFLDFGDNNLYWMRHRPQIIEPFPYVQIVTKADFISKYSV